MYQGSYATDHGIFSTAELLKHADGRCGAWARFFRDMIKVQGIGTVSTKGIVPSDIFIGTGYRLYVKKYQYIEQTTPPIPLKGEAAQGKNPDPHSRFSNHGIVMFDNNSTIYDPSYGKAYPTLKAWEDQSLDALGYLNRVTGKEIFQPNTLGDEQTHLID